MVSFRSLLLALCAIALARSVLAFTPQYTKSVTDNKLVFAVIGGKIIVFFTLNLNIIPGLRKLIK